MDRNQYTDALHNTLEALKNKMDVTSLSDVKITLAPEKQPVKVGGKPYPRPSVIGKATAKVVIETRTM